MTDTVEPITRGEREKTLQQFLDRLYSNRQVCGIMAQTPRRKPLFLRRYSHI